MLKEEFPVVYFDSNTYHEFINNLQDLKMVARLFEGDVDKIWNTKECQREQRDIDDGVPPKFGWAIECTGPRTYGEFLEEHGITRSKLMASLEMIEKLTEVGLSPVTAGLIAENAEIDIPDLLSKIEIMTPENRKIWVKVMEEHYQESLEKENTSVTI